MREATPRDAAEAAGRDDPRVGATLFVGAIGIVILAALGIGLDALHRAASAREVRRKLLVSEPLEPRALAEQETRRLGEYRWVDRERGIVAIPIERAMELVAAEAAPAAGAGGPGASP